MTDGVKKGLLVVAAIALIAVGIFVGYRHFNNQAKNIQTQRKQAEQTLAQLQALDANRQTYIDGAAQYEADFNSKLELFPSNWDQEYQVELIEAVRKNEGMEYDASKQTLVEPTLYYTLGGSNAEASLEEGGEVVASDDSYEVYYTAMDMDYYGGYEGIKDFIRLIMNYGYRMTIDKVTMGRQELGEGYAGAMTVNQYYITGKGREEHDNVDLSDVGVGKNNIFEAGEGGSSSTSSKFSADSGAAIVSDYDLFVAVNPTSSDTSGKQVSVKSTGASITSDKNSSEQVSIEISNNGDTYTVIYGIGSEKKTAEFAPGEDLTLLVQSSAVSGSDDKNAVNLKIENNSDKTLYVKVADDTDRRVKVAGSTGSVVVFK